MKKLAIAITSLLLMTGCSSTPTITNTNNIKEHILKDNVAYESFSSYNDSDTIIRLPNGEYIHGTKEVNGKYYDSDQDSGAIQAKKAKYYALLATDVNNYLTEKFEGFNDSDEVFYNKEGSFTNASTVIDENGNEKDLANNPDYESMTIKEAKEKGTIKFGKVNDKSIDSIIESYLNANKTSAAIPQPDAVQAVRDERLTVEDGRAAGVPDGRGQIAGGVELRLRAKLGAEMVSQPVQHPGSAEDKAVL